MNGIADEKTNFQNKNEILLEHLKEKDKTVAQNVKDIDGLANKIKAINEKYDDLETEHANLSNCLKEKDKFFVQNEKDIEGLSWGNMII